MNLLPPWALTNPFPAVFDIDSATVTEQTAKMYGAMNELIKEYNAFADAANKKLQEFTETETAARKEFELAITKVMNDFRCCIDQYLKLNLSETARTMLEEMIENGEITITQTYDPDAESLNIGVTNGGEE